MSNALTFFDQNLPALPPELAKELGAAGADFSGGLGSAFRRIALRSGRFRLIEGGNEQVLDSGSLSVGIIGSSNKVRRQFFMAQYEQGSKEPPTCWSDDGDRPANDVPPERRQSNACMACKKNEKGSANNGEGRACSFRKNIVVGLADNGEGGLLSTNTAVKPWLMTVNAMSMFGKSLPEKGLFTMSGLAGLLKARKTPAYPQGVPPGILTIDLRIDQDASVPKLWFAPVSMLPQIAIQRVAAAAQSMEVKDMLNLSAAEVIEAEGPTTEVHYTGPAPTPAAPAPAPAAAQPRPAPAPTPAAPVAAPVAATRTTQSVPAWKLQALADGADEDTIGMIADMGGPWTPTGGKLWTKLVGTAIPSQNRAAAAPPPAPVAKTGWREYGEEVGAEADDLDMVADAGGPGTPRGRKLWDKLIGADLTDDIDLGVVAEPAKTEPEAPKTTGKRGRPAGSKNKPKEEPVAAAEPEPERVLIEKVEEGLVLVQERPVDHAAEVHPSPQAAQAATDLAAAVSGFAAGNFDD